MNISEKSVTIKEELRIGCRCRKLHKRLLSNFEQSKMVVATPLYKKCFYGRKHPLRNRWHHSTLNVAKFSRVCSKKYCSCASKV